MKLKITILLLTASIFLLNAASNAGALNPDCSAKKAGKNAAMKATIGVGGRCSPAEAAKGSAKGVADVREQRNHKGKNKDKDTKKPLNQENDANKGRLKKVIN